MRRLDLGHYRAGMTTGRTRRPRMSEQCFQLVLSTPSLVFPIVALTVSLLTFASKAPSVGIIVLLAVALVPWVLMSGGVELPPLLTVAITLAPTAVLAGHYLDQAAIFLGVVTVTWAAAQGLRWATWTSLVGFGAAAIVFSVRHGDQAGAFMIWITGLLFSWFAGFLLHRQRTLTDELAVARHDLDLAAIENERKSIAREVHDIVGHSLTVVLLNISGARRNLANNPVAAADALERAEAVSRDSLETIRAVVTLLSTADESQRDAPLPGGADVAPLLDQARQSGMPIVATVTGDPARLEPSIGLTVVRLLQESLSNASRHAPGETVDVDVRIDERLVVATVSNAMPAVVRSASDRVGIGVAGMTDRVAAIAGSIQVGPHDGRWIVRASLPRPACRSSELSAS
ncbi:MAG: integral rane sensor signal transduction histidine kinase [Ilumatobacteraceae bacterium]|nr:integral rane sensor signal transduction histidine kinase [Ilumatobacteraceae bacterium]